MILLQGALAIIFGSIAFYTRDWWIGIGSAMGAACLTMAVVSESLIKRHALVKIGIVVASCGLLAYSDKIHLANHLVPLAVQVVPLLALANNFVWCEFIYGALKQTWWQRFTCLSLFVIIITAMGFYGATVYDLGGYKAAIASIAICVAFCNASLLILRDMGKQIWQQYSRRCCRKKNTNPIEVCVIGSSHHKSS